MEPAHLALLMLAVALALLCAEFFVPSGGMILVMATISLVVSMWLAWRAWGESDPTAWWSYVASVLLLIPGSVGGLLYFFPKTSLGKKVLLQAPSLEEVTPYADEQAHLRQMIGKVGRTLSLMTPGGMAVFDGERMHCESEGVLIEPDMPVRVVGVNGNRLVVRLLEDDAETAKNAAASETDTGEPGQLDFDLPQS